MRKIKLFLILNIFALWLQCAFAAAFIATVQETKIQFGQPVQLTLRLDGARARDSIDLSELAKDFNIYNQHQFSSYSNTNGTVRAEIGWNVTLMPKKIGEFVIPAIVIDTDKGKLSTDAIKISVTQNNSNDVAIDDSLGVSLVSEISQAKAYVNQPIIYTLKVISYKPLANVVLDDIKSTNAIVEKLGDPKHYDQNHGGVHAHIVELRYAITAMKPGKINIIPATMHGEIQVPAKQAQRQPKFGLFNNLFFDNAFELKPFSLQSEDITIDIVAPPIKSDNWLPLYSLAITEKWDGLQTAKVGDTVTRKVKIVGKGTFAKQLPNIKEYIEQDNLKVYANKPNYIDVLDQDGKVIVGTKEEEFSIVLQQAGNIIFPEIKIKWWNVRTNKLEVSVLPAKTINVLPAAAGASDITVDYSSDEPQIVETPVVSNLPEAKEYPVFLYAIIGILTGIVFTLMLVIGWIIYKRKYPAKVVKLKVKSSKHKERPIETTADLRDHILHYAIKSWQVPANIALNRLGENLNHNNFTYDIELFTSLSKQINAGLYAKYPVDIQTLIELWEQFKKTVIKNKLDRSKIESNTDYSSLNPT
jgi:hypothetical protein